MSDYVHKLLAIALKKQKLVDEETKLIERRKAEIATLAEKFQLPTASDVLKVKVLTSWQLRNVISQLVYLKRQYQRMMTLERKHDTRRKIQLGDLIKKAGLEYETTAVLYSLLLEATDKLASEEAERYRPQWRLAGDLTLTTEASA